MPPQLLHAPALQQALAVLHPKRLRTRRDGSLKMCLLTKEERTYEANGLVVTYGSSIYGACLVLGQELVPVTPPLTHIPCTLL